MPRLRAAANRARTRRRFIAACFALGSVAVGASCSPTFNWREFRSPDGFAVVFPGRPQTATREVRLPDAVVQMSMTSTGIGATLFAVGAAQLPSGLSAERFGAAAYGRAPARCAGAQRQRQRHSKLGIRAARSRRRLAPGLGRRGNRSERTRFERARSAARCAVSHCRRSALPGCGHGCGGRDFRRRGRDILHIVSTGLTVKKSQLQH